MPNKNTKKWYTMTLTAGGVARGNVLLTEKEVKIVSSAIKQMENNSTGDILCRGVIEIDDKHPRKNMYDYRGDC